MLGRAGLLLDVDFLLFVAALEGLLALMTPSQHKILQLAKLAKHNADARQIDTLNKDAKPKERKNE